MDYWVETTFEIKFSNNILIFCEAMFSWLIDALRLLAKY